ncbi:MAG: DUF4292 domain-containing protein [Clostridium sp.]|nr:DUF4292 domain-containing protein [Clostridium sp.]
MKRTLNPQAIIAILCAMAIAFASCGRKKPVQAVDFSVAMVGALPMDSVNGMIGGAYQPWRDVQMPVTVTMIDDDDKGQSMSGRLAMVRDSAIEISLRAMGVEAALAYIDPDTVVVVDKYHKQYLAEPYPSVFGASGLSLGNLQDALLGAPFSPQSMPEAWSGRAQDEILQSVVFQDEDALVVGLYGDKDIDVLVQIADKRARMAIKFNYDQAKWDTGRKIRLRAPKGGSRIYGVDIMQSIYSEQQ